MPSSGAASASRIAVVAVTASTGCRMTRSVQRCQNPGPPSGRAARRRATSPVKLNRRPRVWTRRPSRRISTGSSVVAARMATATTSIAPSAIERIAVLSIIHSPASEMITVRPLNSTARPDVAIATARASSGSRPAATSSR